jgi:hypothetical protein
LLWLAVLAATVAWIAVPAKHPSGAGAVAFVVATLLVLDGWVAAIRLTYARRMTRVFGGMALVAAGVVAFIETHSHLPEYDCLGPVRACERGEGLRLVRGHLTETPYDWLYGAAWVLVIIGAVLFVVALVAYARR